MHLIATSIIFMVNHFAIPKISLQDLKQFLMDSTCTYTTTFSKLRSLILKYRKEIPILFINSIFKDNFQLQDIIEAADFITLDCLHNEAKCVNEHTITELESFLSDLISFHNEACMNSNSNKSNYFQTLFSIISEKYNIDIEDLLNSISNLVVEIEKVQKKAQRDDQPSIKTNQLKAPVDALAKVRSSLARAEQHLKRTRDDFENERNLFVENFVRTDSPQLSIPVNYNKDSSTSTNHCDTQFLTRKENDDAPQFFLYPFIGDVMRLNRKQFPALFEHEKEQENIIKQEITEVPSQDFSSLLENSTYDFTYEQTMWFSVQYQIFHQYLTKSLTPPQHLLRALEYFKERHELKKITCSKENMKQFNVLTERKDFSTLKDMIYLDSQYNMSMMHPYLHSYYYYYYSKLFQSHFSTDHDDYNLAIDNDPLNKLIPPRKKINRYAFGKQFSRHLAKQHTLENSSIYDHTVCPEEYGFPFRAPDQTSSPNISISSSSDTPTTMCMQLNDNGGTHELRETSLR